MPKKKRSKAIDPDAPGGVAGREKILDLSGGRE